jgi:hypothetical protein
MDDEALKAMINRIDHLDSQLKAVEGQKRDESHGWWSRIGRVGIVVGCLGGIPGGTATFQAGRSALRQVHYSVLQYCSATCM